MKPLWFISGIAVAAVLLVGIGVAAAFSGTAQGSPANPAIENVKTPGFCGCGMGQTAGGCGAAGCTAGCAECQGQCGGGCSGGCSK